MAMVLIKVAKWEQAERYCDDAIEIINNNNMSDYDKRKMTKEELKKL
jgi:hypothetical protein